MFSVLSNCVEISQLLLFVKMLKQCFLNWGFDQNTEVQKVNELDQQHIAEKPNIFNISSQYKGIAWAQIF